MASIGSKPRIAAMAAVALALCGCSRGGSQGEAPAPPPSVTVIAAASKEIRPSVTFTGRVQAQDKVELRARIDGYLEKRLFEEGQDVKVNDLLFVIEQAQYKATVAETKANIDKAQAAVTLANIEYDRASRLVQTQAGTQARLDDATAKREEARGEVARLKAALEKAELQLSYTEIRAPVAGRIGRSNYSVGNFVSPQSGPLATIVRQDPIYVVFPVTAREMLEVRKETKNGIDPKVFVQLADGSRYPQPGKVNFVDVTVNPGTDTVLVRAVFSNPDRILVDGQLVTVVVEEDVAQTALVIPQRAIQSDQGGAFVLLVDSANKVEVQRIDVDQGPGDLATVKKGLVAGDKVIVDGAQKVHPGQVVNATEVKGGV